MKKELFFSFYIILLLPLELFAQGKGTIKGKILTTEGVPAYVTVSLKNIRRAIATDNDGNFALNNLPPMNDTLLISSAESKSRLIPITLNENETLDLGIITQFYSFGELQNIEIAGRTTHSYKSDYSFLGTKIQSPSIDIPQSISTITKELIEDRMSFILKDAVTETAGVNAYSGYDEYTIRGFRAENARLINGLRGYTTTYTSPMLMNIERIEIVKGPAATLYGNSDPGGTINLVTKKPLAKKEFSIGISGGTWDHYRARGDITGPVNRNKTLLFRFNAGYDNTKSFRNQYFAKCYQLSPSLSYIPNDKIQVNVDFSLSHINTILDRGQPGFENDLALQSTPINLSVTQPGDFLHETDCATNILFSYKINKHISFNSGYLNYITHQSTYEHGINSYITPDSINLYFSDWDYHTTTNTFTNYFTYRLKTGKFNHQFIAGYDYIKSKVKLNQNYFENADQFGTSSGIVGTFSLKNPVYVSREINKYDLAHYESDATGVDVSDYHTNGVYLQDQMSFGKWKLLLGVREELYRGKSDDDDSSKSDINQNILLPRIGLVYQIKPGASLYATYNKGFDPFEASTSTQQFDEPFMPIISELFETGAKANLFNNKLLASISLYQLVLKNVAVNANDISNPNLFVQRGEDRSRGIELEAYGNILQNISVSASWAYNITKIIKSKNPAEIGRLTENAPKYTSNLWIKYTFNKGVLKGLGIAAGYSQVSVRKTLQQGFTLPGYVIINAGLRYGYKRFNFAANFNNITNKTYWTGAYNTAYKWPGAPANFMISTSYGF